MRGAHLLSLPGLVPYGEALALQRSVADGVKLGELPDTVILLEHEPVITLGRRTDDDELHLPDGVESTSSRPTAGASRPTTGPASSSVTRSSTSTGMGGT